MSFAKLKYDNFTQLVSVFAFHQKNQMCTVYRATKVVKKIQNFKLFRVRKPNFES